MNTQTRAIDTQAINQSIDLRDYAGRYSTLRRESAHELAGPCPKCGGDDRFHCDADWFFCRQCHTKRGDAIEFVTWKDGVSFKEAVATLTNTPMPIAPATRRTPTPKRPTEQPQDWQRKAEAITAQAHARLLDDNNEGAEAGRHYLEHVRKLEPHVWQAFNLGFTPGAPLPGTKGEQRAPAIVIPWYRAGKVVAIRFRFLQCHEYIDSEGKERKEKQTALNGSSFGGAFYGEHALETGIAELSTLLICEGEVNSHSIWQVAQDTHLDVLSLGSESATITPIMAEYAARHATVIVWMDKAERAQAVSKVLLAEGVNAWPIQSQPMKGGDGKPLLDEKGKPIKRDANDLLKSGELGGVLAIHRLKAADTTYKQERLLWDLWDAARAWNGVDTDTKRAIAYLSTTLGKSVSLIEVRDNVWRVIETQQPTTEALPTDRPALPVELHRSAITDYSEAWATWETLRNTYQTAMGKNADGYYIKEGAA